MMSWSSSQWLFLSFILGQFNVHYVASSWPSTNSSNIQLLGLFENVSNTSESSKVSVHSRAMFKAAVMVSQQYNITIEGQLIEWQSVETGGNTINALTKACQALSISNIVGIVGPQLSREAHLIADLAPSDNLTALAIVKLLIRFNWTSCILIYQNDAFGSGGAKVIDEAFTNNNLLIEESIIFDIATLRIRRDLKIYLKNSATRIVVLWVQSKYMPSILRFTLKYDLLGPHFTWILSSTVSLNVFDKKAYEKLIGLFVIEPITENVVNVPINTTLINAAYQIWQKFEPESFPGLTKLNYYALFALDATWSLIQSLEKLCSTIKTNSSRSCWFIIKYKYSDHSDWETFKEKSVIVWPGNSLVPPTGRAILKGIPLRIGVIESVPFTIITHVINEFGQNTTKLTGYIPELIELLRKKIGFIPNIDIAPSNQTYIGLIQAVANGDYDIVIGDVIITAMRRESVGFSNAIFDNSLRIIMRKTPDVSIDLLSFLKPFSQRKYNEKLQNRSILSQITMSIWYSFGNIVGYGVGFHVRTAAGRLVAVGLYMLSLILVASYTANLASDLTISKSKDIISSIEDIKNGKISFNRIGVFIGTASEDYYLREISSDNKSYYPLKTRQGLYDS
ncbi:unnamed protein product [Rotaria sp. Silwood2]|nr:unnamed protein product [Rotaria sp. Silwood2]CAF4048627.1 unnamed protein product [Rotaria sp. Silwood2]